MELDRPYSQEVELDRPYSQEVELDMSYYILIETKVKKVSTEVKISCIGNWGGRHGRRPNRWPKVSELEKVYRSPTGHQATRPPGQQRIGKIFMVVSTHH